MIRRVYKPICLLDILTATLTKRKGLPSISVVVKKERNTISMVWLLIFFSRVGVAG